MADDQDEMNGPEGEPLDPRIREELRQARDDRKELAKAKAQFEALNRENAFSKAGIPEDGMGSLFRKSYDGDLDPAAIKAQAESYGLLQSQPGHEQDTGLTDQERQALQRQNAAGTGIPPQGQNYMAMYADEMANTKTTAEVMEIVRRAEAEHPEIGRFTFDN